MIIVEWEGTVLKLFQVRKGQFVYYENELHQVYTVKFMLHKSIHLYRLKDMQQILTQAGKIQLYKPKHMDSLIFYGQRYTIDRDKIPQKGDYILIVKPAPEFLNYYSLNEIAKVSNRKDDHVVTTKDNGVRHHEYVVMVPGKLEGSLDIAYFDRNLVSKTQLQEDESPYLLRADDTQLKPVVGDIYLDHETNMKAMITAMTEREVVFAHGPRLSVSELIYEDRYTLIYRAEEGL